MNQRGWQQRVEEKIRKENEPIIKYVLLQGLAEKLAEEGNFGYARSFYEQALKIAQEMGNSKFECDTLIDLGSIAELLGEIDHAGEYCEKALKVAQNMHNTREQSRIRGMLGTLAQKAHNPTLAADYFEKAVDDIHASRATRVNKQEEQAIEQIPFDSEERELALSSTIQLSTEVSDQIKRTEHLHKTEWWLVLIPTMLIIIALIYGSRLLPILVIVIIALTLIIIVSLSWNNAFLSLFSKKNRDL